MLKRRVVVLLTFLDGVLFRTKKFIPDYRYTLKQVDLTSCDEAVCIHLGGDWDEFARSVRAVADHAGCPLAVGGGITEESRALAVFRDLPADKIVLGPGGWSLAKGLCDKLGRQSVVGGYTHGKDEGIDFGHFGEILLQSVERDGSLLGYDLGLLGAWIAKVDCPLVIGSGCGSWRHMKEAFDLGADGCATNNIFHFTGPSLGAFKRNLVESGAEVRP